MAVQMLEQAVTLMVVQTLVHLAARIVVYMDVQAAVQVAV